MKQLIIISQTLITLSFLSGCGTTPATPPSQNSALNSISKSNASKEKKGIMQESLDSWLKDDWTPTVSKDKNIQEKYHHKSDTIEQNKEKNTVSQTGDKKEEEESPFTLQEYVDKAEAYMKAKPNDYENSNVKKLESLPVIGK